jgi:hypothetical protein
MFCNKYWILELMFISILISLNYHPNNDIYTYSNSKDFILSYAFLTSLTSTSIGIYLIYLSKIKEIEKALWHLTNATWWSLGCDVFSGLFSIMPNLNNIYKIMDTNHLSDDNRHHLDSIYWSELFIHIPLSLTCFYFYITKNNKKYFLETFLSGIQLMGTIAYYLPEILNDCIHWKYNILVSSLNLIFGSIWILYPIIILKDNINITFKIHDS